MKVSPNARWVVVVCGMLAGPAPAGAQSAPAIAHVRAKMAEAAIPASTIRQLEQMEWKLAEAAIAQVDARLADLRQREENARQRAEDDRQRAEDAKQRAEDERQRAEELYQRAQELLEDSRWAQAIDRFQRVVDTKLSRVDAALYWKAYAQSKLGQQADALATVAELLKAYPASRWLSDAKALEIQVRQTVGQPVRPEAESDEELKLLAIQGLQHSDPEQAVPMLEKFLQGNQSPRLKERALFVLAQSNSDRARQVLTSVARGGSNPDLQRKAIQYLGVHGRVENRQILADVYAASTDVDVKRQILRAFMVSGDRARVVAAATTEKTPELRTEAVRQLGAMGAREELWQLYQKDTSVEVKRQILQSLFVAGDAARIEEVATTESNTELRRSAVRHLGTMGARRTGDALVKIYANEKDADIKRAVIQGLFVQGNAEGLVAVARKETNIELKKDMVQKLSNMRSKVALDYLMEILGK